MARPKSDDRRNAILAAAIRIIASQGLSAPTALIAKEAGVSNGSLFTYFDTKADLLNQLYVELKTETAFAALNALRNGEDVRSQMAHIWSGSLRWATSNPDKRRTLAYLTVSGEITEKSHQIGGQAMAGRSINTGTEPQEGANARRPARACRWRDECGRGHDGGLHDQGSGERRHAQRDIV